MTFKRFDKDVRLRFAPVPEGGRRFRDFDEARRFVGELATDSSDRHALRRMLSRVGADICDLSDEQVRDFAARALATGALSAREYVPGGGGGGLGAGPHPQPSQPGPSPGLPGPGRKPKAPFTVQLAYVDYLAPGAEDPKPLIRWTITDPDVAIASGKLELSRSHDGPDVHEAPGAAIWTRPLAAADLTAGEHELPWDGKLSGHPDFPGDYVSVEFSPYTLKITVTDGGRVERDEARFLVEALRLELELGTEDMVELEANKTILARLIAAGTPLTAPLIDLPMPSNLFKEKDILGKTTDVRLTTDDRLASFAAYHARHSSGPHVPLIASLFFRDSHDREVLAPRGWGRRQVLWSYEYTDMNGWLSGPPGDFVRQSARYLVDETQPPGTACHEDRGGKRSATGHGHFAAVAGAESFPSKTPAVHLSGRFTGTVTSGELAGRTAVLFSPAAQAGDGYVVVARFDSRKDLDVAEPRANVFGRTGTFQVTRRVTIAKLLKKQVHVAELPAYAIAALPSLQAASVVLEVPDPSYEVLDEERYRAALAKAVAACPDPLARHVVEQGRDRYFSGTFLILRTREEFTAHMGSLPREEVPGEAMPLLPPSEKAYYEKCEEIAGDLMTRMVGEWVSEREGLTLVFFDGFTNLESRMRTGIAGVSRAVGDPRRGVVVLFNAPFAPVAQTLGHEIGHRLFLTHAPATNQKDAPDARPAAHDADIPSCLMSSDPAVTVFCGLCVLRLRGWDTRLLSNHAGENAR
ncbi:MAG: hypothetical protein HY908_02755 [Myxococcales bacterium]|nr:hypothetical protein [Myxococcales bacterium]